MVPAGEFKAKCLQILDEVNRSKEPVTVTKRGKPVARIISIPQRKSAFGSMAGTVLMEDDIVGPIDEPWDADRCCLRSRSPVPGWPGSPHGDPADRVIVASARHLGAPLVTADRKILAYSRQGHLQAANAEA